MCQVNSVMATALTEITAFHTRRPASQRSAAGRTSITTAAWKTARAAMHAVVGNMLLTASPRTATIDRG